MTETTEIEHALAAGQMPSADKCRPPPRRDDLPTPAPTTERALRAAPSTGRIRGAGLPSPSPVELQGEARLLALLATMGC